MSNMEQYGNFEINGVSYHTEGKPVNNGSTWDGSTYTEPVSVYAEANTSDHWLAAK